MGARHKVAWVDPEDVTRPEQLQTEWDGHHIAKFVSPWDGAPHSDTCRTRMEKLLDVEEAATKRETQRTTTRDTVESQDGAQKEVETKTEPTSQLEVQSVQPPNAAAYRRDESDPDRESGDDMQLESTVVRLVRAVQHVSAHCRKTSRFVCVCCSRR